MRDGLFHRNPEFAEPSERMELFVALRDRQQAAFAALVMHVEKVSG